MENNKKIIKCDIYPCILVRKGYVTDKNYFHCVAFERYDCVWNTR